MKKDYIFFDFDGTLVDTSSGIFDSLNYSFEKMGEPILSESDMRKYIGPPLLWSFMNYNNMDDARANETVDHFHVNYRARGVNMHSLYNGVEEMLCALHKKGKIIVLATSKPEDFAVKILKDYDLYKYFDFISGATFDGKRSSKKEVLIHALELCKPDDLGKCVLVGDTENDAVGARQVGIDCVGVLYGFGKDEQLKKAGAVKTVASAMDVVNLFD